MSLNFKLLIITLIAAAVFVSGCSEKTDSHGSFEIAVTNSYLGCAVDDICVKSRNVFCLAPPGMCPGHFDISPSQIESLCRCRLFLFFDFQKNIGRSVARMKENGPRAVSIRSPLGFCVPQSYIQLCREVCSVLKNHYPEKKNIFEKRLKLIEKRLATLADDLQGRIASAGLAGETVLASAHQARFAEWLGLDVVATFKRTDSETASHIQSCLEQAQGKDIRFIITNKQEGSRLGEALGQRLNAGIVVFSNFPGTEQSIPAFDKLLKDNLESLIKAAENER